nr:peptidoglycan-binding protein [Oceanobacillus polygoni]
MILGFLLFAFFYFSPHTAEATTDIDNEQLNKATISEDEKNEKKVVSPNEIEDEPVSEIEDPLDNEEEENGLEKDILEGKSSEEDSPNASTAEVEITAEETLNEEEELPEHEAEVEEPTKEANESIEEDLVDADLVDENEEDQLETFSVQVAEAPFQFGDRHNDIVDIKKKLNKVGFGGITETTLFGSWMETRVKQFQSYYGLSITGEADDATLKKLDEVYNSPFQEGKRHNDTATLKEKLNRVGYGYITVTTLYGSFMDKQVRKFQKDYGLRVNGIMDEVTLNKLNAEVANAPFQKGDHHNDIVEIKKKLNRIGFDGISETALYGSWMETRVKQFQSYYGLSATGKADAATTKKLDEVYNSPFQEGKRHNDITTLKEKLNRVGYGYITITTLYGSFMDKQVRKFQKDHGLRVNGIMDEVTLKKLNAEISKTPFQKGDRHNDIVGIKKKLNRIGFGGISETTLYGSWMETRVKQFQSYYGLSATGKADAATTKKLDEVYNSPFQQGKRHSDTTELKEKLNQLGYGYITVTTLYGSFMDKQVRKFQKDNGLRVNGIADEVTVAKINKAVKNNVVKIFLDPGHGGHDPGGEGYGLQEKNIVLDIALRTAEVLAKHYIGVEVMLSRTTDKFIELTERARMANNWNADYFVSFHTNAFNGEASGFESFIHNGEVSKETRDRHSDIHNYLAKKLPINDRGMKEANFNVLRNSNMPSILLEYMFIDNKNENSLLKSSSYRQSLGKLTADAIANSFNLKRR